MNPRALSLAAGLTAVSLVAPDARATGFTDVGQDLVPREASLLRVGGDLRLRAELLNNLDLDRGLSPSGQPLFPVALAHQDAQTLSYADMRLRTDLAFYAPGGGVAVKARIDVLDNQPLGGSADGVPSTSTTQLPPSGNAFRLKRAYGEALLPFGLLAAGRMGNQWGLGILANGGDCADCDSGDAVDRIALLSPIAGHVWALAYDFSATGALARRVDQRRFVDVEPAAAVRSITFAVLSFRDDLSRARRRRAGKGTFEYGAYASHRWQSDDVPASYLATAQPPAIDGAQVVSRGFRATAVDGWLRLTHPYFRIEAEAAVIAASIEQPSLLPGVHYRDSIKSTQLGGAIESEIGAVDGRVFGGVDGGFASGDPAPGFGANPGRLNTAPRPGDIDGPQADLPRDARVDNFRFHSDYRVDRILFRELIGAVTDAAYLRPHARAVLTRAGPGTLTAQIAGVASWSLHATSTPGGASPLGVEIDPTLHYASRDGFGVALEYAVLFPLAGLDNPAAHLAAQPAQLGRVRFSYRF